MAIPGRSPRSGPTEGTHLPSSSVTNHGVLIANDRQRLWEPATQHRPGPPNTRNANAGSSQQAAPRSSPGESDSLARRGPAIRWPGQGTLLGKLNDSVFPLLQPQPHDGHRSDLLSPFDARNSNQGLHGDDAHFKNASGAVETNQQQLSLLDSRAVRETSAQVASPPNMLTENRPPPSQPPPKQDTFPVPTRTNNRVGRANNASEGDKSVTLMTGSSTQHRLEPARIGFQDMQDAQQGDSPPVMLSSVTTCPLQWSTALSADAGPDADFSPTRKRKRSTEPEGGDLPIRRRGIGMQFRPVNADQHGEPVTLLPNQGLAAHDPAASYPLHESSSGTHHDLGQVIKMRITWVISE